MTQIVNVRWQMRRDTAANLASTNEVPLVGEWYYETDTGCGKVGDGFTHYNDLLYSIVGGVDLSDLADGKVLVWREASSGRSWVAETQSGSGGGGGSASDLATAIEADSPSHYWKCNETSGTTLADSGSGGSDLTLAGSGNILSFSELVDGDGCFFAASSSNSANGAGFSGAPASMPVPWNYDWSFCCLTRWSVASGTSTNSVIPFCLSNSGETEAANEQLFLRLSGQSSSAVLFISAFWENGAGINTSLILGTAPCGDRFLLHLIKDSTAKTLSAYINGRLSQIATYTNEPTGGTTANTKVGQDSEGGAVSSCVVGHIALWHATKLSLSRIKAHAKAAGVY